MGLRVDRKAIRNPSAAPTLGGPVTAPGDTASRGAAEGHLGLWGGDTCMTFKGRLSTSSGKWI